MHFGFALELSDIDLWNTDLLDTHLDLLSRDKYTDIPSKYFVCLHKIFKRSSRHVFKTSSRRLKHVFNTSWKTQNCYAEDVLKTSSTHVLKTSSRPTNVCWEGWHGLDNLAWNYPVKHLFLLATVTMITVKISFTHFLSSSCQGNIFLHQNRTVY